MYRLWLVGALAGLLLGCADRDEPDGVLIALRARTTVEWPATSIEGREYVIRVSVPDGPAPAGGFPVIYVLDGDAWFGAAAEVARLREYSKLPPAVIVGIAYPDRKFFDAKRRGFDFTPPGAADDEMQAGGIALGGAAQFLRFINETLKPELRRKYSLSTEHEALFGHSLGGLFVLYAMYEAPESFETFLAASPSMGFSDGIATRGERDFESHSARTSVRLLVTAGEFESPKVSPGLKDDYRRYYAAHPELLDGQTADEAVDELFAPRGGAGEPAMAVDACALVMRLAEKGVNAHFAVFPGEEHGSAAVSALNRGVPFALRPEPERMPDGAIDCAAVRRLVGPAVSAR